MKIKENFLREQIDRCRLKANLDDIDWFNDYYSDMFSLDFDSLFSTVDSKFLAYCYWQNW